MTVSYSRLVANGSSFGCFWSILRKWKGSVYKLVWRELIVYLLLYYAINSAYRYAMTEYQQKLFAQMRNYFKGRSQSIPMSFVLGFYVTLVVRRWWEQYRLLPWPDTIALFVSAAIPGADERGRLMRRTIVRYAVLAYVITLKHVSVRVKKRFPTLQHIVDAGFMMDSERKIFEWLEVKTPMTKYWLPLTWATNIINRARKESLITNDHMVQTIMLEMSDIRNRLGSLIGYDNVNIPIVYTQVVTLSVYSYFLAALIGAQMIPPFEEETVKNDEIEFYFPIITVLEFCFYLGWLKVAEVLIGPFGEDDDDIELNWLIDRHIKAAYMIVDEMHEEHPELLKDQYWDEVVPKDLPYTVGSEHYRREEPKGSAEFYKVKQSDALYANISNPRRKSLAPDEVYADYESVDTPVTERKNNNNNNNKSWFQRQITRTGLSRLSGRSSSTVYSTAGAFFMPRPPPPPHSQQHGPPSIYTSASAMENGTAVLAPNLPSYSSSHHPSHKISFYDRLPFVGRKSSRKLKPGFSKANGSSVLRCRPKIPTPDSCVANNGGKECSDGDSGIVTGSGSFQSIASSQHNSNECAVVQMMLTPIQELEGLSLNGQPLSVAKNGNGATALAQAVLAPALKSVGLTTDAAAVSQGSIMPVTVSVSPVILTCSVPYGGDGTSIGDALSFRKSPLLTDVTDVVANNYKHSSSISSNGSDDKTTSGNLKSGCKRSEVYV